MSDSPMKSGDYAQQPSAKWCFVCGVENPCGLHIQFFNDGPHRVTARVTLDEPYQSYPGIAHGGILSTILDETMGRAVLSPDDSAMESPRFMFTARMALRFRHPVPLRQEFTARGWVEKTRGRMVTVAGEILLVDGTVAVEASAVLADIPQDQIDEMMNGDVGWQVYPDETLSDDSKSQGEEP